MFIYLIILIFSISAHALPNFAVEHKRSAKNFAEIQITNKTSKALICYVAIDGQKIRFILQARQPSKWYKATDIRYNYHHFSTWCDFLSLYPEYQQKRN